MRDTSKQAYYDILPDLGKLQNMVFNVIRDFPFLSDLEIAYKLNWAINRVTPRRNELSNYGLIEDMGTKVSPITGKKVHCWRVKEGQMNMFAA